MPRREPSTFAELSPPTESMFGVDLLQRPLHERAGAPARLVTDHASVALSRHGLWATLARQVHDFADGSGLQCHDSIDIAPGLPAPEGAQAAAILRIFQEVLHNVACHARASEVTIRVRAMPGDFTLLVKDNGRGAPPSSFERPDAHGVIGMRALASQHGGWLQLSSAPGEGTQVILSMPLGHDLGASSPPSITKLKERT